MALTAFSCNLKMGLICDSYFCPHTIMPSCKKERNKALHKQIKMVSGSKFLILKNIPHVLVSFFVSSLKYHFQFRCSSRRRPKNSANLTLLISFFPI